MNIILASQSPNRHRLLQQVGIPFQTFIPNIDENKYLNLKDTPQNVCLKIAEMKALKAYKIYPKSLIIASDQLAYLNQKFYGKAGNIQTACQNLLELQSQTHLLITSLFLCYKEKRFSHISVNKMSMRALSLKQIQYYVSIDQPLKCAGSYHIESIGLGLFEKIETNDFNSIIGLPLTTLVNQLILWKYPYLNTASL